MPRLFFINRFYWPDEPATAQLLGDLAEALAATGWEVTVIASHPGGAQPTEETRLGVRIVRVRSTRLGAGGAWSRLPALLGFLTGSVRTLDRLARPGDLVVPLTDPPLLGVLVARRARRRRWRVIHWVQDVYPEVAMAVGGAPWLGFLRFWRDRAWRQAEACVVLGADMATLLRTRGVAETRLQVIPNWAPRGLRPATTADIAAIRAQWGVGEHPLVVMYSGNLGRVHDLEPVLVLAERLRAEPGIVFVFVGGGARRAPLEARAAALGLKNIRFLPHQPRERLAASLSAGDIHLVTLHPACAPLVFPSKLYGIAAVGRPVLFVGPEDCELARLIEKEGLGHAFARDRIEALAATLLSWRDHPETRLAAGRASFAFSNRAGQLPVALAAWQHRLNPTDPSAVPA